MAEIRLDHLTKRYGKDAPLVVDDVSLVIKEGEFVVLLGPSGCGKSTILRMIAGLEEVSGGDLWFDGRRVTSDPPDRRSVGMVFQNYALYPHMTVRENLSFGLRANRAPKAEVRARVEEVADLLGLRDLLGRRPKALSGGQRQRVALGRALMRRPALFLMDEPLSNLDANLRDRMRMELARLHVRLGITTVYVTHDQGEALTLADRVVVMDRGRIRQAGTPAQIYGDPSDIFVAGFVGSPGMNLWTLHGDMHPGHAQPGEGALQLPPVLRDSLEDHGSGITMGVRPEHLRLAPLDNQIALTCQAVLVENMGSHVQLHVEFEAGGGGRGEAVARLDADARVTPGQDLVLYAHREAVHLFDSVTGARVQSSPARLPEAAVL